MRDIRDDMGHAGERQSFKMNGYVRDMTPLGFRLEPLFGGDVEVKSNYLDVITDGDFIETSGGGLVMPDGEIKDYQMTKFRNFGQVFTEEMVWQMYKDGDLSSGQAGKLLGRDKYDFLKSYAKYYKENEL